MRFWMIVLLISVCLLPATLAAQENANLYDTLSADPDFSTLVSLLETVGLDQAIAEAEGLTIFAPTDDAFSAFSPLVVDYLIANPDLLTRILTYHVVPDVVEADAVLASETLPTLEGEPLTVDADLLRVNGATILATDIRAANGIIHVIDSVVIPTITLPPADPFASFDPIIAAGSSTVRPLTERMAQLFEAAGFAGGITVEEIGTGGGFERFCVNGASDISNASRPIRESEIARCRAIGREPIGFFVGVDALAITVSTANDFVDNLTTAQLAQIFSGEAVLWSDIDPSYPSETIFPNSPGADSGTQDYFVEEIFDNDETPINSNPNIQLSEDDTVLVQNIEASPFAIGYFGFAYYIENQDGLRVISIEGVAPTEASAESGEYPLSRPLFIYTSESIIRQKPQIAEFINFYIENVQSQLGTAEGQIGYFPVSRDALNLDRLEWLAALALPE